MSNVARDGNNGKSARNNAAFPLLSQARPPVASLQGRPEYFIATLGMRHFEVLRPSANTRIGAVR